jgi:NAD(P)H-nitrite reductase large subunit
MITQPGRPAAHQRTTQRYVIIGTGVAAIAAAEAIRSLDRAGSITFIGEDPHGFYSRPGLAYYLTGEVDEKQLFPYRPEDYKQLNAHFYRGQAAKILANEKMVELNATTRIPFDRLLIATGSSAMRLTLSGANLEGVVKLDHMDDARRILAHTKRARTAVVVGGGITALELAEGLAAQRVKIHYVIRNERYWPNVLDEVESQIIEKRLKEAGVSLHYQTELAEIVGINGKVTGVKLTNGKQIGCEMVAYAIGIAPRTSLAKEAGITCDRGILVNENMGTNLPGIFAAGDVAQVYDPLAGKHILDSLWTPAREQGRAAGLNMAGRPTAYLKAVPFNVTRLAGLTTTIIGAVGSGRSDDLVGIARGDSETWREIPDAIIAQGGFEVNHLRLMVGEKHILGAIVMGDQKLSSPLQAIVRDKVDISPIRAQLLAPNAPIADITASFWAKYHGLQRLQTLEQN